MRRPLKFENLTEAILECETLLESGYTRQGNWTLGQICCHLRLTMEANMTGYPTWMTVVGFPLRPVFRFLLLPRLLAGNSPKGVRTAGIFVPPDHMDDVVEVASFKRCVSKFLESNEPLHPHPGFGRLTKVEFDRFHAAHAAHHLSFLATD